MTARTLDIVLIVLLGSYAVSGRSGDSSPVLSSWGSPRRGMAVLPGWFDGGRAGEHPFESRALLIGGLSSRWVRASPSTSRGGCAGLHAGPTAAADAVLGGVASLIAVAVLVWFVAAGLRGSTASIVARDHRRVPVLAAVDALVLPGTRARVPPSARPRRSPRGSRRFSTIEPIIAVDPANVVLGGAWSRGAQASLVKVIESPARRRGPGGQRLGPCPGSGRHQRVQGGIEDVTVRAVREPPALHGSVAAFDSQRDLAVISVPGLERAGRCRCSAPTCLWGRSGRRRIPCRRAVATGRRSGPAGHQCDRSGHLRTARRGHPRDLPLLDSGRAGQQRRAHCCPAPARPARRLLAKSLDDDQTGYALTPRSRAGVDRGRGAQGRVDTEPAPWVTSSAPAGGLRVRQVRWVSREQAGTAQAGRWRATMRGLADLRRGFLGE